MAGQQDPSSQGLSEVLAGPRLPRSFFARDVLTVAPALLGATVRHAGVTIRLTEVEAYSGESDPGSHAFRGPTPRTEVMFGPAGHLYVYFTYGMHWCANIVCGDEGAASAVLLRAGEVVQGEDVAASRREGVRRRDWARGPARLATTLGLDGAQTGLDACTADSPVTFHAPVPGADPAVVQSGPRVGVSGAGGDGHVHPWRFWLADEPTVSVYRPAKPRARRTHP
ncbi:DNA-3-methyladenine glycosylase [Pedococcus sp. KACC 23699]|uniref:Putative 3-methyladenine DNA glycosylase n=1 Tax=Pedococcus sp. KACC 23699 TaxID=3149228 RepID=A0AAU7JTR1_9MICO